MFVENYRGQELIYSSRNRLGFGFGGRVEVRVGLKVGILLNWGLGLGQGLRESRVGFNVGYH